jgi:hypothetical protein
VQLACKVFKALLGLKGQPVFQVLQGLLVLGVLRAQRARKDLLELKVLYQALLDHKEILVLLAS